MKRKITIALIICVCLFISVFAFVHETSSSSFLFYFLTRYYESDPTDMIAYLNDRYSLVFPQNMSDVRAAKATNDASGNSSFIIRFQIPPEDINSFLSNFAKSVDELQPYDSLYDYRSIENNPEWFTSPIKVGRMGHFYLHAKNVKYISFTFKVNLDLSNDSFVIVYMEGNYKSDCG